ncbi:unnamed protein product [Choristocarpus tenellus]
MRRRVCLPILALVCARVVSSFGGCAFFHHKPPAFRRPCHQTRPNSVLGRTRGKVTFASASDGEKESPNFPILSSFISSTPMWLVTGAAAASEVGTSLDIEGTTMGPRLDGAAAASFAAVMAAFTFLQVRIRGAINARTARREFEKELGGVKSKNISGMATNEELVAAESRMSELIQEEEKARYVNVLGIPFNLVIPDGAASQGQSGQTSQADRKAGTGGQMSGGLEQDSSPASTFKVALLWLVLVSQVWLLAVFANDPMGHVPGPFLHD